jgi:hypothetical protein
MVATPSDRDVKRCLLLAAPGFVSARPIATAHVTTAGGITQTGEPSRAGHLAAIQRQIAGQVANPALPGADELGWLMRAKPSMRHATPMHALAKHHQAPEHTVHADGPMAQSRATARAGVHAVGAPKTLEGRQVGLIGRDGGQGDGFHGRGMGLVRCGPGARSCAGMATPFGSDFAGI